MGSPARTLGELLATGKVVRSRLGRQEETSPRWGLGSLAGRFVEITGQGGAARLTAATRLVAEAQRLGEPVAWVSARDASFYPPDVATHGVDLAALAVIVAEDAASMLRAADHLLRAGAFGLVVLDLRERIDVPMQTQVRLANLAKGHDATLVCVLPDGSSSVSRRGGSMASLRARSSRERSSVEPAGAGRFSCSLHVHKDKRRGREWEHVEVLDGPVGLR